MAGVMGGEAAGQLAEPGVPPDPKLAFPWASCPSSVGDVKRGSGSDSSTYHRHQAVARSASTGEKVGLGTQPCPPPRRLHSY